MPIPEENEMTFSNQTRPTKRNRTLTSFYSLSEFLTQVKRSRVVNWFVKNGTANFGQTGPTEISGPPLEVIPNIPVGRNQNEPFHLTSQGNFRNLWHNGKHLQSSCVGAL